MKFIQSQLITTAIGLLVLPAIAQESGKVAPAPSTTTTGAGTTKPTGATAPSFGYYAVAGRIYRIENGRAVPVMTEQAIRIGPKGMVGFDGRPFNIPEGQMIGADGRLEPLPANIVGLPKAGASATATAAVPAAAVESAAGNAAPAPQAAPNAPALALPDNKPAAGNTGTASSPSPTLSAGVTGSIPEPPLPTAGIPGSTPSGSPGTVTPGPTSPSPGGAPAGTTPGNVGGAGTGPGTSNSGGR